MPVIEAIDRIRDEAVDVALFLADEQYKPGSNPSAFLGVAALFSGVSAGAFYLAGRFDGTSPAQRLKKISAVTVGVGAAGLAGLDAATYAGHRIKGTAPYDNPTVIGRALENSVFQENILGSSHAPIRFAGAGLVVAHAFASGILEPNHGQASQ